MKLKSTILALLTAGATLASVSASAAEFTIASIKALTGPLAFVGVPEANAVKMAIDELNAANYLGAGNTLKLVSNDDQNDRAQITTLLTRAARVDNALIVLGGGKWTQKADRIPEYGPAVMVIKNGKPTPVN